MPCHECKKEGNLYKCNFCHMEFCINHLSPHSHDCPMYIPDNRELMKMIGKKSIVNEESKKIEAKQSEKSQAQEPHNEIKDHEVPLPPKESQVSQEKINVKKEDIKKENDQPKLKPLLKKKRFSFFKLIIITVLSLILALVLIMILNYKLFATKLAEDPGIVIAALLIVTVSLTGLFYLIQFLIRIVKRKLGERKNKKEMSNAPDVPSQTLPGQEKSP